MEKEELFKIIDSWNFWSHNIDTGIMRESYSNKLASLFDNSKISIIIETGIRRAGKSFIAKQIAKQLIDKGISKNQILIINLEDEHFIDKDYSLLLDIYKQYKEKINSNKSSIIIIDEAQEVKGWERFVRGLSEKGEARFIITGSSSTLLDSEYTTLLSGRQITAYIQPLNFLEYIKFSKFDKRDISKALDNYISEGGFPAVALSKDKEIIIKSYFDTIILKDVIQRYKIQKQDELIRLAKFYITSIGSKITFNSISKFLKLSVKTVYNFSFYLEKSYLIFFIDRFSYSIKVQDNSPRKVYTIDNSFPSMLGINSIEIKGRLLENTIASTLYLISRHANNFHFYYWYENSKEVDFIINDNKKYRIVQVAYSISNQRTKDREVSALLDCANRLNVNEAEVVTLDYSGEELINGVKINYIRASDWIENILKHYSF
ncbi:MAG: ATP-binding protein [Candidatus Marsarchaeota archaeon]|jgi:predicted AAA+ superfamily ATPase|nr:ATP-binding protein [Candidatus Marsarchaeota archaeon]